MKSILSGLALAGALVGSSAWAGDLETRLMDDLLQEIGDPALSSEVRILTRLDRLYLEPRPAPPYEAGTNTLALMVRPWWKTVYYTTRPEAEESTPATAVAACPGESEPFTFSFFAARDATITSMAVTPPQDEGGHTLPPSALHLYRERSIFMAPHKDLRIFRPFALEPVTASVSLLSNVTTRFWVDISVPSDTPAGLYTGRVDVATEAGPFSFPYTLQVYPFTLQKPQPNEMAWGFWFPPPSEPETLRAHLRFMADHGLTTFALENWDASVDDSGKVTLQTEELDRVLDTAQEAGLTGPFLIGVGLGGFPDSGAEYSPTWKKNYQKAIALFAQHMAQRKTPYMGLVFDEPRETNIRPCNRNREQMLAYLDLIDRAAPDMRTMVNPMTDEVTKDHPEGYYTIFAEKFDVIMPHFWARASNLIARAQTPGGAELWSYNDGPNRLGWGLHSWANRLHGRMQYAWHLNRPPDHPYAPVQRGTFEYGGHHPGMHLWAVNREGPLQPTPRLLGIREGIDDYRYVYTLERVLDDAPASETATAARAWLEKLRTEVPPYAHASDFTDETAAGDAEAEFDFTSRMDNVRQQAATFIQQLSTSNKSTP